MLEVRWGVGCGEEMRASEWEVKYGYRSSTGRFIISSSLEKLEEAPDLDPPP